MTPDPTAPDPVSEARDELDLAAKSFTIAGDDRCDRAEKKAILAQYERALDAFASAVRADERARCERLVEGAVREQAALWLYSRETSDVFGVAWERKRGEYEAKVAGLVALVLATLREPETTG